MVKLFLKTEGLEPGLRKTQTLSFSGSFIFMNISMMWTLQVTNLYRNESVIKHAAERNAVLGHPLTASRIKSNCATPYTFSFNLSLILLIMDVVSKKNIPGLHYSFASNVFLNICNLIIFLCVLTTMD